MRFIIYLTLLCTLLTSLLSGQNVRDWTYNFQNFGLEDGLPSTEVYHVMQDKDLNLWFCTDRGVVRYDGHEFKAYNKSHGLPDLTIFKSYQAEDGKIWFSSFSHELSYFENDSIYLFDRNEELLDYWQSIRRQHVSPHDFFVRNDTIFVGIQRFHTIIIPKNGKVQEYIKPGLEDGENYIITGPENQSFGKYRSSFSEVNSRYKYLYTEKRLNMMGRRSVTYRDSVYELNESEKTGRRINVEYHQASDKALFTIGTYLFSIQNKTLTNYESFRKTINHSSIAIDIYLDKKDGLWISTVNNGAIYYPSVYELEKKPEIILKGHTVSCVFQDNEGGYWFTTTDAGVFYISEPKVKTLGYDLHGERVNDIIKYKNKILVGFQNGKLDLLGKNKSVAIWENELPKSPIYSLYNVEDERLIIGTVRLLISENNKLLHNKPNPLGSVKSVVKNSKNEYYVCAAGDIHKLREGLKFNSGEKPYHDMIFRIRTRDLVMDSKDTLWIGCRKGVLKSPHPYEYTIDHNMGIGDIREIKIRKSKKSYINKEGIIYLEENGKTKTLKNIEKNYLNCIEFENDSILWVGGSKGLIRLNTNDENSFKLFNDTKGLCDNDVRKLSLFNDTLWVGTANGLNFISLKDFSLIRPELTVFIDKVLVNGTENDNQNLSHNQNKLEFIVKGVNLNLKDQVSFQYKIEGINDNWNNINDNSFKLQGLKPDNYTIMIRAYDNVKKLESELISYQFIINPPFWKTWWFISLLVAFFITLVIVIFTRRIKELREKNRLQKEAFENERKALVESQKALRAQMNPHFLFNSLNSVYHLIIKEDLKGAKKTITKLSKLMRGLLEGSREELIEVDAEVTLLTDYLNLQKLQFENDFSFDIKVDKELDEDDYQIHSMLIQPFVENAIIHGLLPLKDRLPHLSIEFKVLEETKIKIRVKDNGVGRKASNQAKKDKKHKSLAMTVTQERLKHLSTYEKEYYFRIEDLDDGTLVELIIPLV